MRRLSYILIIIFVTLGVSLWAGQNYFDRWEPQVRAALEKGFEQATGLRLELGPIGLAYLHRIDLHQVRVWKPTTPPELVFQASRISLKVSLPDIPRALYNRRALDALGLIHLEKPWLDASPEVVQRIPSTSSSSRLGPLFFSITWIDGMFRWSDSQHSSSPLQVADVSGVFKIRGPRMTLATKGKPETAELFRLEYARLGKRWNGRLVLKQADIPMTHELVNRWIAQPLSTTSWKSHGHFSADLQWGDRQPLKFSARPWIHTLQEGHVELDHAQFTPPAGPSLSAQGRLIYEDHLLKPVDMTLTYAGQPLKLTGSVRPFESPARAELDLTGTELSARIRATYQNKIWVFADSNQLVWMEGVLGWKGVLSNESTDVHWTLENLSLQKVASTIGWTRLAGQLKASGTWKGPLEKSSVSGAYWISGGSWEGSGPDDLRGEFEITSERFSLRANMQDPRFRLHLQGSHHPDETRVDNFEVRLRSGGSWAGQASSRGPEGRLSGTLRAENLILPDDLPFLNRWVPDLQTTADIQMKLFGTRAKPGLQGEVTTQSIQYRTQTLKPLTLSWVWENKQLKAPFTIPGSVEGKLLVNHATNILQGSLSLVFPWFKSEISGKFNQREFQVEGALDSPEGPSLWTIPLQAKGQWSSTPGGLSQCQLTTRPILIRGKPTDPLSAIIEWDSKGLRWKDARWGTRWSSQGSLIAGDQTQIQASVKAVRVGLREWMSWTQPSNQEHIGGFFNGDLEVTGPLERPDARLTAQLNDLVWRSMRFDGTISGQWTPDGLQPLTISGRLFGGGRFRFQGGYKTRSGSLHGILNLESWSLLPIGKSLNFPKPLEGSLNGTLTVSGPMENLQFTGHLDGGPILYGKGDTNPFRMESFSMDMTAGKQPDQTDTWRLTFTEAQARTAEETIRFQKGSFLELSASGASRLNLKSEIRNLKVGLVRLFGGLDWEGTWQIRDAGFAIEGQARTRSIFINDYELQEGELRAAYYDQILRFSPPAKGPTLIDGTIDFHALPQLRFSKFRIVGKQGQGLELDGDIGPSRWDFRMAGQRIDLGILGGMAAFPYPLSGSAEVAIRGTGDLKNPHAEGSLKVRDGRVLGLSFTGGEAKFLWRNNRLSFQQLQLTSPGRYTLIGAGGFPLTATREPGTSDRTIDFTVRLDNSNLGILQSIMPEVRDAKGAVEAILQITGTSEAPQLKGQVRIQDGELHNAHYFRKLENIQLDAIFQGQELHVKELRGTSGKGEILVDGKVGFSGFTPSDYNLQGRVTTRKSVEIQVPELAIPESPLAKRFKFLTSNSYGSVHGDVRFQGPALSPVFSGSATITNGHFTFPPSRKRGANPAVLDWFNRVRWDVVLRFQDDAWFENDYVAANLIGQLGLKGPHDRLRVDGGLDVTNGRINYLGIQFDIRQARMDIRSTVSESGLVFNTPYLRGVGDSRVQSIDTQTTGIDSNDTITLTIDYAPLGEIKPRLTSLLNPNLTQEKLLARVGNLDVEKLSPQERSQLYQQQMVRVIDASLATPLARKFLRPIGLNLRSERVVDPGSSQRPNTPGSEVGALSEDEQNQPSGLNLLANSKYTLETNVNERLALGYGIRFMPTTTDTLQNQLDLINDLQLSYRLFRGVYVRGSYELPNASNPSYIPDRKTTIEKQWRFPWTGFRKKKKPEETPPSE